VPTGGRRVVQVDTSVASFRYKDAPEFQTLRTHLDGAIGAISVVTFGECLYGARFAGWSEARCKEYDAHLRKYVILPIDHEVVSTYARVGSDHAHRGVGISDNDLWIAATAIRYGLPLLTRDSDFRRIRGLDCLPREPET
jgi:tRNA(fMet)-specific endonuclease VapC